MRQLAAYEAMKSELTELGVTVVGASVDDLEHAKEVVNRDDAKLSFPMAYGLTKADADLMGSWWSEDRGGYIQPSEFLISRGGVVIGSLYASGPVGRMGVDEVIRQITNRERRRREQEGH